MHPVGYVRPLEVADSDAVRERFRATAAAGRPLWLPWSDLVAYESLCLDYYLQEAGSASGVLVRDAVVIGYALVALDHGAYLRWMRPRALRWAARALAVTARAPGTRTAAFHRRRLEDGFLTLLTGMSAPMPGHLHVNVAAPGRGGRAGFALAAHADAVVGRAGLPGYFGEVNVAVSKPGRHRALERLGTTVVHRQRNRTMSWLAGEPVERLTVVRSLDPARGWVALPQARS